MNDLDLLAAVHRPIPEKPKPDVYEQAEIDAPRMCRDILLAIPADNYELRNRVTNFFSRVIVVSGKHVVDEQLLHAYHGKPDELLGHVERQQRQEAAIVVSKYAVQAWKNVKDDGYPLRELTTQVVIIKPRTGHG